ncbi:hypothetical protein ACFVKB_01845 [Rhodococcus sp. NPDC127530]|uniref:hypothetical protein n=1 Tax=unclassified Rhodococcus (in: high G+C Gram-positive bacteria) TaxID=192944 RepID=UPI0036434984
MTATPPQADLYDLAAARSILERVLKRADVPLTKPVTRTRATLTELAESQALVIEALRELTPTDAEKADILAHVADGLVDKSLAPKEVGAYLHKLADTGTNKQLQSLINQVAFRYNKQGTAALRQLGDALVTDLLRPWADRITGDLLQVAPIVLEHGPNPVDRTPAVAEAYATAGRLTDEMNEVWSTADGLRRHGILTGGDVTQPLLYRFARPQLLADADKAHRSVWFLCHAVAKGAQPTVATHAEAAAGLVPA